ncbi:N-acetylmuramoyl-L-alanine amidase [Plantactinospora sp. KBS50]|uniref:N-acetylmuramoyl-L-alanine amidase n=1 Tax=Plantactinospora sp. KBS50 TaxID=2024580 RepID=UPI000BAB1F98|nr:N-acetylmuramoyl-L-alanine amidase [Plantactinospora sp. KBS50]ASW53788.1 N-acetylmuramoyl-L-alanine amidase [Plantactinospora sp. KBS50]
MRTTRRTGALLGAALAGALLCAAPAAAGADRPGADRPGDAAGSGRPGETAGSGRAAGSATAGSGRAAGSATAGLAGPFARAARDFGVPRDLLVAVGYSESRLTDHQGLPSQDNGFGVMHLADNPYNRSLPLAADLTGTGVPTLKTDVAANIRGAAAVLASYAKQAGITGADPAAWYPAVARYAGATSDSGARLYADHVYQVLNQGIGGPVPVPARRVRPQLGRYADVQVAGRLSTAEQPVAGLAAAAVPEYPGAHWVAANGNNYSPGRSAAISTVVIHVTQGSYAGTVNWFQNPSAGVSAHYVVRSSDGDITQMVREQDTAYHVINANSYAVGIEHEGYVDQPAWFTDVMYRSSAALTRYLCDRWGLPRDRAHIKGHYEMPGNDHTDPGPNWNWNYYISLVNSGGSKPVAGSSTDFNGDGKDDIITFTLGTRNDVYVATSTGSAFAGTSVKWSDYFGLTGETPLTGDFNGDGKDDIITFTGGTLADVYVELSTGTTFCCGAKWHDWFAPAGEIPAVGDVNGDGKDDIITFTHNNLADVYVALSTGTTFTPAQKWHDWFAPTGETPAVADVNGDGKADIITFTQGTTTTADVYVALSTGTTFQPAQKWHDLFSLTGEQPRVGDINGDGKADIVTFTCNPDADVYAATSTGTTFTGTTIKWHDHFCLTGEHPYLGDVNGDGKDDLIVFTQGTTNDVYTALSTGTTFQPSQKWHDYFGLTGEITY